MNVLEHIPSDLMIVIGSIPAYVWYAAAGYYSLRSLRWVYRRVGR